MIKKIGASLLTIVIAIGFTPVDATAASASANKKKAQKTFTKLKKIGNGDGPNGKVNNLSKKLFKLDPKKSTKYYKTAVKKFIVVDAEKQASKLAKTASKTLAKSGLPENQIKKIEKQIDNAPVPTPTPYQAFTGFRDQVVA